MSEMLANQYFMARNFSGAEKEFVKCLFQSPDNLAARKKLIICNTQTGNVPEALVNFLIIIRENIKFIIDTAKIRDDCPCPKIINHIEELDGGDPNDTTTLIILGILWLYCDRFKSEEYLHLAMLARPADLKISEAYEIIQNFNHLNKTNKSCII